MLVMGEVMHGPEQGNMGNLCPFYCEPETALKNKAYLKDYIVEKTKGIGSWALFSSIIQVSFSVVFIPFENPWVLVHKFIDFCAQ